MFALSKNKMTGDDGDAVTGESPLPRGEDAFFLCSIGVPRMADNAPKVSAVVLYLPNKHVFILRQLPVGQGGHDMVAISEP